MVYNPGMRKTKKSKQRLNKLVKFLIPIFLFFLQSCSKAPREALTIGYLLNMTHAVPILGIETGKMDIKTLHFYSGGYLLNSLLTGDVDIAYIGPAPYLNAKSKGVDLKILDLVASGGNTLIVSETTLNARELKKLAIPQQGNTQDILAKLLMKKLALENSIEYLPVSPAEMEMMFYLKSIDSALVSEPWGTLLAHREDLRDVMKIPNRKYLHELINELNSFPATLLVVRESFYKKNKEKIDFFLENQNQWKARLINYQDNPLADSELPQILERHLESILEKDLDSEFIKASLSKIDFKTKLDESKLETLEQISRENLYIY
jgi:ABC-type nitrate/sulfonate/bicarbonate transport system substrate-binding protein